MFTITRTKVWAVSALAYVVSFLYFDGLIPLANNSIPLQWLAILGGLIVALATAFTLAYIATRKG
jgi:hypothetical protein